MTNESEALLSDLVDGLDVDPELLTVALREPSANDTLVAFARIRRQFSRDEARPSQAFYASMPPLARTASSWRLPVLVPWFGIAALLVLATATGLMIGRATVQPPPMPAVVCMDRSGSPHEPGKTASVDGLTQECVARGDWLPIVR
jgi:hypothetical protein